MRVDGVKVTEPAIELLVLPRPEKPIVFKAKGLKDMDEFEAICPVPKPPGTLTKEGWVPDEKDKTYLQQMQGYSEQRLGYMVIATLEPSNIEWETVKRDNPRTWSKWQKEMLDSGLTQIEVNRVLQLVIEANALSEEKLRVARDVFLLGQALEKAKSSGLPTEPATTPSGELAPVSA